MPLFKKKKIYGKQIELSKKKKRSSSQAFGTISLKTSQKFNLLNSWRENTPCITAHVKFSTPRIFSMYFDKNKLHSKWIVLLIKFLNQHFWDNSSQENSLLVFHNDPLQNLGNGQNRMFFSNLPVQSFVEDKFWSPFLLC